MTTAILATVWTSIIAIGFVAVSFILIGVVLLQKNRGSGLSGAFGGVGGHSAFGTKTGDVLTWFTVGVTGVFLLLAVLGNYAYDMSPPPKPEPIIVPTDGPPLGATTLTPEAPAPVTATPVEIPITPSTATPATGGSSGTTPPGTGTGSPTGTTPPVQSPPPPSNPPAGGEAPKTPN